MKATLLRIAASFAFVAAAIALYCTPVWLDADPGSTLWHAYKAAWGAVLSPPGFALVLIVAWSAYSGGCLVRARVRSLEKSKGWLAQGSELTNLTDALLAEAIGNYTGQIQAIQAPATRADLDLMLTSINDRFASVLRAIEDERIVTIDTSGYAESIQELRGILDTLNTRIEDDDDAMLARDERLRLIIDRFDEASPNYGENIAKAIAQLKSAEDQLYQAHAVVLGAVNGLTSSPPRNYAGNAAPHGVAGGGSS